MEVSADTITVQYNFKPGSGPNSVAVVSPKPYSSWAGTADNIQFQSIGTAYLLNPDGDLFANGVGTIKTGEKLLLNCNPWSISNMGHIETMSKVFTNDKHPAYKATLEYKCSYTSS